MTGREVIRCPHCRLNQYRAENGRCRKCGEPFPAPVVMHEVTLVPCQDLFPLALRLMFRAYRGDLSQDAMGGKMRAFHTYISNIERGETIPGIGSFERFAKAFGVPAWQLMSEIECLASLLGQAEV